MSTQQKNEQRGFWQSVLRRRGGEGERTPEVPVVEVPEESPAVEAPEIEIAPNDPLLAYLASSPGVVEVERLELDSPALRAMKAAEVKVIMPLVSQGELIGLLNLGPRRSQQEYSSDDRKLLGDLASQTAPAVRLAQLVRQQQIEAQERERIEQELRVARLIQQTLLPKEIPTLSGYELVAHYQPAREVGGDFYDFVELPDGRLGIVVGDVTDKGVPAALVMATTRSILRAAAQRIFCRARSSKGRTTCSSRTSRPTCSSPASTPSSTPGAGGSTTRTPATTCPTCATTKARASFGPRGCRWA